MPLHLKSHRADLRKKDADTLRTELKSASKQLMDLRFQKATGALENGAQLALLKREVARIRTVLGEQHRASAAAAKPAAAKAAAAAPADTSTTEEG
jgi:large subunit ribosomal protein L29